MSNEKGIVIPLMGTILIVVATIGFALLGRFGHNSENTIIQKGGTAISLSNNAEFWIKSFDESFEIISKRTTYDLGNSGGIKGSQVAVWNATYPSIDILKKQLENKIKENLPQGTIKIDETVTFGEGLCSVCVNFGIIGDADFDGDVDSGDLNKCQSVFNSEFGNASWDSHCDFNCNGKIDMGDITTIASLIGKTVAFNSFTNFTALCNKNFYVYDETINSKITLNPYKIKRYINSTYFKLINAGRAIMEDSRFNTKLDDITSLLSEIYAAKNAGDIRFKELDITSVGESELVIEEKCSSSYCWAPLKPGETGEIPGIPYYYLKLKFRIKSGGVSTGFDYKIQFSDNSLNADQGKSVQQNVQVILLGVPSQKVDLTYSITPNEPKVSISLTPSTGTPTYYSTMNIQTDVTTPVQSYTIKVTGSGGGLIREASFTLNVVKNLDCLDGTVNGACSTTKPLYCDNGNLVSKCSQCKCDVGTCQGDETCGTQKYQLLVKTYVDRGKGDPLTNVMVTVDSTGVRSDGTAVATFSEPPGYHFVQVPSSINGRQFSHFWDEDCNKINIGYFLDNATKPYRFEIFDRSRSITAFYKIFTHIKDLSFDGSSITGKLLDEKDKSLNITIGFHKTCSDSSVANYVNPNYDITLDYYNNSDGTWNNIVSNKNTLSDGSFSQSFSCGQGVTEIRAIYTSLNIYFMPTSNVIDVSSICGTPFQTCSDGTPYEQCSSSKPQYCDSHGNLVDDCKTCGCQFLEHFFFDCRDDGICHLCQCLEGIYCDTCLSIPKYCDLNGNIIDDCNKCGCPHPADTCNADGSCTATCKDSGYDCLSPSTCHIFYPGGECDSSYTDCTGGDCCCIP